MSEPDKIELTEEMLTTGKDWARQIFERDYLNKQWGTLHQCPGSKELTIADIVLKMIDALRAAHQELAQSYTDRNAAIFRQNERIAELEQQIKEASERIAELENLLRNGVERVQRSGTKFGHRWWYKEAVPWLEEARAALAKEPTK